MSAALWEHPVALTFQITTQWLFKFLTPFIGVLVTVLVMVCCVVPLVRCCLEKVFTLPLAGYQVPRRPFDHFSRWFWRLWFWMMLKMTPRSQLQYSLNFSFISYVYESLFSWAEAGVTMIVILLSMCYFQCPSLLDAEEVTAKVVMFSPRAICGFNTCMCGYFHSCFLWSITIKRGNVMENKYSGIIIILIFIHDHECSIWHSDSSALSLAV